jgi:hypothetical protein
MMTLGFIAHHRPDIHIVTDRTESKYDPDRFVPEIESSLVAGKKVGLFFWDEDFIMPNQHTDKLVRSLEPFANEPVYLCSNMDGECLLTYGENLGLPIKTVHVPWWYVNMLENYRVLDIKPRTVAQFGLQFACYVNRPEWHKSMLQDSLISRSLDSVGDIRYQNQQLGAGRHVENPYYHQNEKQDLPQSHDMKRSMVYDAEKQIWICHNSRNLVRLDQMLGDIPLVINSESNVGIFCMTEKSLWPLVLGKLTMIQARPRFMQWFGEYVGYDFSSYLDLEYDSIDGWTPLCHRRRVECMIDKNLYLITHAREAWHQVKDDLHSLAQELPARVYKKFCDGLDAIR